MAAHGKSRGDYRGWEDRTPRLNLPRQSTDLRVLPFVRQYDKMSDTMSSQRITIRISSALGKRLKEQAGVRGRPESEIVREALETYFRQASGKSAYELAKEAGLIGR